MATLEFFLIVTFALTAAWTGIRLCSKGLPPSRQRFFLWLCCASVAVVFGGGGGISAFRVSHSARPYLQGTIANLKMNGGKTPGSYFDLVRPDAKPVSLRLRYHEPPLANGTEVNVRVLQEYGAVLEITLLSGPHAGWHLEESGDIHSAYLSIVAGSLAAFLAAYFFLGGPITGVE